MICGEDHNKKDCKANQSFCINCGGSHTANSNSCSYIKDAKIIEKIRADRQLDYHCARKVLQQEYKDATEVPNDNQSTSQAQLVFNSSIFPPLRPSSNQARMP